MKYVKAVYDGRADVYLAFLENDDLGRATEHLESAFGPARSARRGRSPSSRRGRTRTWVSQLGDPGEGLGEG